MATQEWQELAARAAEEMDPDKLRELIEELCAALEARKASLAGPRQSAA